MVDKYDDIIDSRDVIERIDELEALDELDDGERDELIALRKLAEEGEGLEDWQYGAVLVRDSYFEDYAREFAEEIDAIRGDEQWPATCIDWAEAARELQMDYTSVEFDGVTYWGR